jgi:hypothetical protein
MQVVSTQAYVHPGWVRQCMYSMIDSTMHGCMIDSYTIASALSTYSFLLSIHCSHDDDGDDGDDDDD